MLEIFTTATKIKNKTIARSKSRGILKEEYIKVIDEAEPRAKFDMIKGAITEEWIVEIKIKIKATMDKGNIKERPNGWLGVRAEKYANITNIPPI